jgi:hypothetical protein
MTKHRFWEIIAASRTGFDPEQYENSREKQLVRLHQLLSALSTEELRAFLRLFGARMDEASSRPREGLWGVAFDIGGGCSDDMFEDFRSWLISMGRDAFEAAVRNPETVYEVAEQEGLGEDVFFEGFQYVPYRVWREKTREED